MDIAVTGATGFVGSALVRQHLQRGDSIRVLVRDPHATARRFPSVRVFRGDLAFAETISEDFVANADVLYHCAAEGQDDMGQSGPVRSPRTAQSTRIASTAGPKPNRRLLCWPKVPREDTT